MDSSNQNKLLSVGIDIGTSTTHIVLSELKLANVATGNQVPKIEIVDRKILYESPIHFTPLTSDGLIDANGVAEIIKQEYALAHIAPENIQTGAVVITGESARKRNAHQVAHEISELAGDFVIASAGAQLEGILAGKGSGAAQYSLDNSKVVCNVDIGGGTTNLAVFKNGECIDTACLEIGGRFIQVIQVIHGDSQWNVKSLTESAEDFLDGVAKLSYIRIGEKISLENARLFCALLSEVIVHACIKKKAPQIVRRLLQADPLRLDYNVDQYWFSGGVAACMRADNLNINEPYPFNDMGALLAHELLAALKEREMKFHLPAPGIRATVIGAGHHSMQLSGCTVMVSSNMLPVKNARILHPFKSLSENAASSEIKERLSQALNEESSSQQFAIAIDDRAPSASYNALNTWSTAIYESFLSSKVDPPLIVICATDIGLALGQAIRKQAPDLDLIVLDGVNLSDGDYIDIGKPLANQQSVPLTVKTLLFHN